MWKSIAVILCFNITYTQCAKFGDDNTYTCHCKDDVQCDIVTGGCSGGCARGWYGASCQKQNVALDKTTSQVETNGERTSDLAVDGDNTTNIPDKCSDVYGNKNTTKWWRVDLVEKYPIKYITIYYRSYPIWALASLNGFSLHVNKENQDPELCYKDNTLRVNPPAVNNIECSQTITGRYVTISNLHANEDSRFLVLCEVEIYVCSVGTFGSDCTNFCHCLNNERCLESGQCPGGCADGWTGPTCGQECTSGSYGEGCSNQCSMNCKGSTGCNHINGICNTGCKPGYNDDKCIQQCTKGFYGDDCQKNCGNRKCQNDLSCNHISGQCADGCSDGYTLPDCSKACDNGMYGAGCSKKCSDRDCLVETSTCNHINGSCQGGCKEGFSGIDCVKGCEGFYGAGCSKNCSDRKCKDSNVQCDSKTGECLDGCQPGYQSIDCTEECDNGKYGHDCQFKCSTRFCQQQDKDTCSNIDGACDCLDGYEGTACTVKKSPNCNCTVKKSSVCSAGGNTGSTDQSSTIIGTILGLTFGLVVGALAVLFIMKRRLRSIMALKSQTVTSNQSGNNATQRETTIDQPVTQPSSNNQDNPYAQLATIYQNENAYERLEKV